MPYIFSLLTLLGLSFGGLYSYSGVFIIFFVHPSLDFFLHQYITINDQLTDSQSSKMLNYSIYLFPLFEFVFLIVVGHYAFYAKTFYEFIGLTLSAGMITGGFGITMAHEFIHRNHKWERGLGVFLLSLVNYTHFRIEHVYGHHKYVSTPKDPASAPLNMNLYYFILRSIGGGFISAIKLENKRLKKKSKLEKIFNNRIIGYLLIMILFTVTVYLLGGIKLILFWFGQSLMAICLLEIINYIEHYGLRRKKTDSNRYEKVRPKHSWDSRHFFTNATLINLGKHSHHHSDAATPYYKLKNQEVASVLPMGYSLAIVLALFPPLWKKIINPLVSN